jgi:hypothetical protein
MYRRIAELQQAGIDHAADHAVEGEKYECVYGARVLP